MKHQKKLLAAAAGSALILCLSISAPAWAASEPEPGDALELLLAAEPEFADNIALTTADSTQLQGVEVSVTDATISLDSADGGFSVEAPEATQSSSVTRPVGERRGALRHPARRTGCAD